jgi:hypothetical protein
MLSCSTKRRPNHKVTLSFSRLLLAQVTYLVKEALGKICLGIGDGANDVGMINAADIGVGISGFEGTQVRWRENSVRGIPQLCLRRPHLQFLHAGCPTICKHALSADNPR